MNDSQIYDVIIIGAGPAGLTAAIYTSRARLSTLVIGGAQPGGQLLWTTQVENYPGFRDGILGPDLMIQMIEQAKRFGAVVEQVVATGIDVSEKIKRVMIGDRIVQARALIITTGARARMLGVGEERLLGRGVGTCAVCDAAFYKGKNVYVVGGGDAAMEDASALAKFAASVTLIHRSDRLRASAIMQERIVNNLKLPVRYNSEVTAVGGDAKLGTITIRDSKTGATEELSADGLFLAIGHIPDTDFIGTAIARDSHGYIITATTQTEPIDNQKTWREQYPSQTNTLGVFAAGDAVDFRYRQAVTAAGMGCQAALDVEKYLGVLGE